MDYGLVRGFNYQPSYGSTSFENWMYFKPEIFELELRRGKHYFPRMNTIRLWLSWEAFNRNPAEFCRNIETGLRIADRLLLKVVPILFNRWHDPVLDCGGIYVDHFLPGLSPIYQEGMFNPYLEKVVGEHNMDTRILAWDLCNEPFSYNRPPDEIPEIENAEFTWLKNTRDACKQLLVEQPIGISIHPGHGRKGIERVEPICDLLMIHPYYIHGDKNREKKEEFSRFLDMYVDVSRKSAKPMLVTETCWGSLNDAWRVANIRYTLRELCNRKIGFIVHALHQSRVADLHGPETGPVGNPGNLAFINADGTIRKGHEVFNDFC
jgi:hypothetical protein